MKLAAFPADAPFLPSLAQSWLAAVGDPSEGLLILPNRRSARAVAGAFLQANNGKALLLPRIIAIGAIDEAALAITQNLSLPPAIPPLARQTILAKLILARKGRDGAPTKLATAWRLAADLAALLDEADLAEINLRDALPDLVTGDLASHWQKTLEFLDIVTDAWPAILNEMAMLNPIHRQNLLIDAQNDAWRKSRPKMKIWMVAREANPALQRLAKTVAGLANGTVILPGYDHELSASAWDAVEDTHPQRNIATLISALGARREDVAIWPGALSRVPNGRVALTSTALLPAKSLNEWQGTHLSPPTGLYKLAARDEHEEAMAIAMALREALENSGQTAALITPDRRLALRVSAHFRRFGILADDSAGEALSETPPALFLRLLARAVSESFSPLSFLSLLKHPLTANGDAPERCREQARFLEISALRGPRPAQGLASIKYRLVQQGDENSSVFLDRLEESLKPVLSLSVSVNPAEALRALIRAGENLSASISESGADRLWSGEAGLVLSELMADVLPQFGGLSDIAPADLAPLLDAVLAEHVVRKPRSKDGHPRIAIWGLQEAILQSVDFAVLGGLVEGVWPEESDPGPWMSRPMRRNAGLISTEQRIGNSAHDFFSLCCQTPTIILAAAKRRDRAPAITARWLTRFDALLNGKQSPLEIHNSASWAAQIDLPRERLFRPKPTPRPPVAFRPTTFSITDIATLINDPYAIYLSKIIKIRKLSDLDEESDAGLFGNIVHAGLAAFFKDTSNFGAPEAIKKLNTALQTAMRAERPRPSLEHWWDARLQRIANWVVGAEIRRRKLQGSPEAIALERNGTLRVLEKFSLVGRADRIERRSDKSIFIMDYKTGSSPTAKTLQSGAAPQLPLEAMMAEAGAFGPEFTGPVTEMAIWKLSGGRIEGDDTALVQDATQLRLLINLAATNLPALLIKFFNPDVPYLARPHPDRVLRQDIFDGISRRAEWLDENQADEYAI